jgi:hypothetical protein
VDISPSSCGDARLSAPDAIVHHADFFAWAEETAERFDCIVGNPPFIRYQNFSGEGRRRALRLARRAGADLSALTSSWAPFIAAASALLRPGGRMAFVVPGEIGHATYAEPLVEALCASFERVVIIAVKEKLFPGLSEDAWLLLTLGHGGKTDEIELVIWDEFQPFNEPPSPTKRVSLSQWRAHGSRLRKFLFPDEILDHYWGLYNAVDCPRLSDIARVGIGYVTGANDFFHLRPSEARFFGIPRECLRPSIRKGDQLPEEEVTKGLVQAWLREDLPILLLDLAGWSDLPDSVKTYLDTPGGREARRTYKCRNRRPWYAVPDVVVPDAFLTYMIGERASFVLNPAGCICTNSVHAVRFTKSVVPRDVQSAWSHPLCILSQEIEGHHLGGGLLKLEPREAGRVLLPLGSATQRQVDLPLIHAAIEFARSWRHYDKRTALVSSVG